MCMCVCVCVCVCLSERERDRERERERETETERVCVYMVIVSAYIRCLNIHETHVMLITLLIIMLCSFLFQI